jgi:hypothetical protein
MKFPHNGTPYSIADAVTLSLWLVVTSQAQCIVVKTSFCDTGTGPFLDSEALFGRIVVGSAVTFRSEMVSRTFAIFL